MGQRKNQNATVAAVQNNIQQQPAWTAKMAMNQKPATPASKPMTRLATPSPQPVQAKPTQMQAAKPTTPSKQLPARAAPIPVETFSGNMFDLPAQWIACCKPASPVARMAAKPKTKKPQFTRKPRAPKNITSEVFNLQSMFNEPVKWATVQACPPKRMPMQMKPAQQQRPMQQQMKQPQQQQMKQPQQQPAKQMTKPATPAPSIEQCMMSMFSEPSGWATQAPIAPKRAAGSPTNRNLPNLPAKQQQAAPKKK
ncbi:hypothetical protein HDU77_003482 [Chytriomyces hyalinus]|nr:hypothetical protein HDU77_003482 [Chytriomyces hyalinus]